MASPARLTCWTRAALRAVCALVVPVVLAAQTPPVAAPSGTCFRPRPLPRCATFWLFEVEYAHPLISTTRRVPLGFPQPDSAASFTVNDLERLLMWHVGQMRNRDNATAVGGSFDLGFSGNGARIGMSARRRTWLTNGSTFEVTGGGAVAGVRGSTEVSRHVNRLLLTGSAELAHDDVLALIVRGDVVPGSRTTAALYGGAELRSTLAVVGTGVGAILLGLFIWALSKSDF